MTDTIPQTDPRAGYLAQRTEIDAAIKRVLERGWYILGQEVAAFEREFAAFADAKHGIGVANGTDALVLGLRALGVSPGDGVVTVSHTAVATVAAIEQVGAIPILVDIDVYDTLDPAGLETVLRNPPAPVKAIVPVHLYGQPAALPQIMALAQRYGAQVLEDCSQAHGAMLDGRQVGSFGQIAAYSLYPTKNLGALGDGGVLTANDDALAASLKALREYGWRERYVSDVAGQNSRLDELQAAILRVKLTRLAADNARRQAIAAAYDAVLEGVGLTPPPRRRGGSHVFHQYVVRTSERDGLRARLKARGIMCNVHYPMAVHQQPAYRDRVPVQPGGLPRTEALLPGILSLPMFPQMADAQVARVCAALRG